MDHAVGDTETWLSLKDTAAHLGVHPATVRRWADNGQIPYMRTPGGHRRFALTTIQNLIQLHSVQPQALETVLTERALVQARSNIVEQHDQEWLAAFDEADREYKRALGRRLMGLMLQYISLEEGGGEILAEAQSIGHAYADNALSLGLPITDVLQATMFFRDTIITTALDLPDNVRVKASDRRRLIARVNSLLNAVQLAVAAVYDDSYSTASNGED
jgi:excisionase family DNA binding protein